MTLFHDTLFRDHADRAEFVSRLAGLSEPRGFTFVVVDAETIYCGRGCTPPD
jgi:hypothetical protein